MFNVFSGKTLKEACASGRGTLMPISGSALRQRFHLGGGRNTPERWSFEEFLGKKKVPVSIRIKDINKSSRRVDFSGVISLAEKDSLLRLTREFFGENWNVGV